jgi:oligopeptide transport system permease protein
MQTNPTARQTEPGEAAGDLGAARAAVVAPRSIIRVLLGTTASRIGFLTLTVIALACFATLPLTLANRQEPGTQHLPAAERPESPAYEAQQRAARHLPPFWWPAAEGTPAAARRKAAAEQAALLAMADEAGVDVETMRRQAPRIGEAERAVFMPKPALGTDVLGRDLLTRLLVGGSVSLAVGVLAAALSVVLGTLYGAIAGYLGGVVDSVMMRFIDVLYGLPYVLLVVLLAVASSAMIEEYTGRGRAREAFVRQAAAELMQAEAGPAAAVPDSRRVRERLSQDKGLAEALRLKAESHPELARRDLSPAARMMLELATLLVAIGGVSWLTMARVVRGQVLSLKSQPFVEAARAVGASRRRIFFRHLLPNLVGPIIVYATLTIPQAILQESFLSFLGIGVKPPLPSWGNLASDGLEQLNLVQSQWWLLVFPCLLLGLTLLALNFVGEALREAFDPKTRR